MGDHAFEWRKIKKTKQPHKCYGCLKLIPAGETMFKATQAFDGRMFNGYWCPACEMKTKKFTWEDWEIFSPGDMNEWRWNDGERKEDWELQA